MDTQEVQKEIKPIIMKLSKNQLNTIFDLHQDKSWGHDTIKANKNTLNSLYFKGLIKSVRYANGNFWEMTDKGNELIKWLNQNK
ncbi:MAG: hypothetical protein IPJ01_11115 [Micavibrio sp.]|nr:hypothetical protein [Micavibrio sp.]